MVDLLDCLICTLGRLEKMTGHCAIQQDCVVIASICRARLGFRSLQLFRSPATSIGPDFFKGGNNRWGLRELLCWIGFERDRFEGRLPSSQQRVCLFVWHFDSRWLRKDFSRTRV